MDIRSINPEIEFDSRCKAEMIRNGDESMLSDFKKAIARAKKDGSIITCSDSTKRTIRKQKKLGKVRRLFSGVSIATPKSKPVNRYRGWL